MVLRKPSLVLLWTCSLLLLRTHCAGARSAAVFTDAQLWQAVSDHNVNYIHLKKDVKMDTDRWAEPVAINRSLTIEGDSRYYPTLDRCVHGAASPACIITKALASLATCQVYTGILCVGLQGKGFA